MDPWRSVHAARIRAYLSTAPQVSRNLDSAKSAPGTATPTRGRTVAPVLQVLQDPWPQGATPGPPGT
jgi:hypothetical protein